MARLKNAVFVEFFISLRTGFLSFIHVLSRLHNKERTVRTLCPECLQFMLHSR